MADDGEDVKGILTNESVEVTQGSTEIGSGGTIDINQPIKIKISFGVPVYGDEPTPSQWVKNGDWAEFALSSDFSLANLDTVDLTAEDLDSIGQVTFSSASGVATAKVEFQSDGGIFINPSISSVEAWFEAELK